MNQSLHRGGTQKQTQYTGCKLYTIFNYRGDRAKIQGTLEPEELGTAYGGGCSKMTWSAWGQAGQAKGLMDRIGILNRKWQRKKWAVNPEQDGTETTVGDWTNWRWIGSRTGLDSPLWLTVKYGSGVRQAALPKRVVGETSWWQLPTTAPMNHDSTPLRGHLLAVLGGRDTSEAVGEKLVTLPGPEKGLIHLAPYVLARLGRSDVKSK